MRPDARAAARADDRSRLARRPSRRDVGAIAAGEALLRARALAPDPGSEWVPLAQLAGRRLPAPVASRLDHPSGDRAAMDGWAVRSAEASRARAVVGESAAGRPFAAALGHAQACRISTGALLPAGADAVVRREDGREARGVLELARLPGRWAHVRRSGEDVRCADELLPAGAALAAHDVSVVAGAGHSGAQCRRRPRVAIMTTGDELVAPGAAVPPGGAVETNGAGLAAQARAARAVVCDLAHARDGRAATLWTLASLLDGRAGGRPDLVISVGGISIGAHDHVGPSLDSLGARWALRGVAMRPGHPIGVAVREGVVVLALPGNPAAAAVGFHLLGRALLGMDDDWGRRVPLLAAVERHGSATLFVRCAERDGGLLPLDRQGSADLRSLAGATALAWIPPGTGVVTEATPVQTSTLP